MTKNRVLGAGALVSIVAALLVFFLVPTGADTTSETKATRTSVATEMNTGLDEAARLFDAGELAAAKDSVNDVYYGFYEAKGFEKVVMAHVSGSSATQAETEFGVIKKAISAGQSGASEVHAHIDALQQLLLEQARALDGPTPSFTQLFVNALIILLREGVEAILVLGAIIAYLVKSGQRETLPTIYAGAGFAIAASIGLAVAINAITSLAGASQEVIEGVTILTAVVMLIWVSNWIAQKASADAWTAYIRARTESSLTSGSITALAAVSFLAVFREGAEVILLFQALRMQAGALTAPLWLGAGVGFLALIVVYVAIRLLAIRIPLKPFFLVTSVLLALMAVSFTGSGIAELQEGDVLPTTLLPGVPQIDWLGIHPTVETLSAQGIVLLVVVGLALRAARSINKPAVSDSTPAANPTPPDVSQPDSALAAATPTPENLANFS
ncbi:MAG: FTR1 family iron permease [Propionibacteriaceae bacterium]|jgi:high-affinity iron transporter|nr:FTR1 family iron permease [Propionibacteriaceae bacterium]